MSRSQLLFVSVFTPKKQRIMLTHHFFHALQISASYFVAGTSQTLGRAALIFGFAAHLSSDRAHLEVQP